jgi:hypothetical protein
MEIVMMLALFALCFALFTTGLGVVTFIMSILFGDKK